MSADRRTRKSFWYSHATEVIQQVIAEQPADLDDAELRRQISAAYPFGERKNWPYTCWLRAVRDAMEARTRQERWRQGQW